MRKILKAFTLIELLVVIAIVGILAGFIFVSMNSSVVIARDTKIKAEMSSIQKAIMEFSALNNGIYPGGTGTTADTYPCTIGGGTTRCTNLETNLQSYLSVIPTNPSGGYYSYSYSSGNFTLSGTISTGPWVYLSSTSSWGGGYAYGQYKQIITVQSSDNNIIAGPYPIKLTITASNPGIVSGHLQTSNNFTDLRFTDSGGNSLSYWVETNPVATPAIVWVKLINGISAGGSTINMYYGTQTSAGSNGDSTFSFFDHFDSGLDTTNKWTLVAGSYNVSGSIASNNAGTSDCTIDTKYPDISSGTWAIRTRVALASSTTQSSWVGTGHNGLWTMSRLNASYYGYSSYTCGWGGPSRADFGTGYTGYHILDGIKKAASFTTIIDGTQLVDNNGNICSSDASWRFSGGIGYGNNATSIDWVAVRKWVTNDPATGNISFGAEGAGQ